MSVNWQHCQYLLRPWSEGLTEAVVQFCRWPHSSFSASAKDITQVFVPGALWSTEGAGNHVPSLNVHFGAVALLLTPWDASRAGFNFLQSEASGEGTSQGRAGHAEKGAGCCPHLLCISHLLAGYKGSALPTEGLWTLHSPGVHHHPELDSVAAERSRALDAPVCSVPPLTNPALSSLQYMHLPILLLLHFWPIVMPGSFELCDYSEFV